MILFVLVATALTVAVCHCCGCAESLCDPRIPYRIDAREWGYRYPA